MLSNLKSSLRNLHSAFLAGRAKGAALTVVGQVLRTVFKTRVPSPFPSADLTLRFPSSDSRVWQQVFVENSYSLSLPSEPKLIIDAGANIGLSTVYFATRYPGAQVIAIEPEKSNFELLQHNTRNYANVTPMQAALWGHRADLHILDPGKGEWGFRAVPCEDDELPNRVETTTIESLLQQFGYEQISILKMDIEGGEREVFKDTEKWLHCVDTIIVELHDNLVPGCSRSFYNGSNGFTHEWTFGENVFLSRSASPPST